MKGYDLFLSFIKKNELDFGGGPSWPYSCPNSPKK